MIIFSIYSWKTWENIICKAFLTFFKKIFLLFYYSWTHFKIWFWEPENANKVQFLNPTLSFLKLERILENIEKKNKTGICIIPRKIQPSSNNQASWFQNQCKNVFIFIPWIFWKVFQIAYNRRWHTRMGHTGRELKKAKEKRIQDL